MKWRKISVKILITILLYGFSILFLVPLAWMVSSAMKFEKDVMVFPIQWIPHAWNGIANFKEVWMNKTPFSLFYLNSIKLAGSMTVLTLVISSMAGFSFAKLRYRGRSLAFGLLMSLMIIPGEATLVPRYILMKWLGLYNSHEALIIMGMFSIMLTFLLRQFILGINQEFLEAATMDGAGYVRMYWQLILPLSKPILATVGILKFIWSWNDYQGPLIFLYTQKLYPITLGMQMFKDQYAENISVVMMASLSAILPLVLIFLVLQKQVIRGISVGGVKG